MPGTGPGVDAVPGDVPGRGEPRAHRLDQGVPHTVHRAVGVGRGGRDGERGHRFVPGDLTCPGAQDQRVPRRNALHAVVRGGVVQRGRHVGRREQRGEVAEVEVGLDEVGQRQRGGRVRGAARPRGVEDRPCAREVAADGDPPPHLDDGRVTAGPRRQMPQRAPARREQGDPQLLVARAADTEDGDAGLRVRGDDAHLVGAPVSDRPQRVGVAPQRLGAHGLHGLAVVAGGPRGALRSGDPGCSHGGAAPPHQPPHRRLHKLGTTSARYELVPHAAMKGAPQSVGGAACAPPSAPSTPPDADERVKRQLLLHGPPDTDRRGRHRATTEPPESHPARPRTRRVLTANPPGAHQEPAAYPSRTRRDPAKKAPRRPPEDDANAPPQRALSRPNTPSTPVVRAVAPRNHRRRFSANSASDGRTRTRSVHIRAPPGARPAAYGPGDGTRPPDRSAARGDVGGGVPQPAGSSTAGRPTHRPWKRSRRGRRRAHARAHGHTSGARDNRPYIHRT
ncbi:hypothetical protein STENM223S_07963 [Streptomyces tendae]